MAFKKGHPGYWKGKKMPAEMRKKISRAKSGTRFTADHKSKISKSVKTWWERKKAEKP